MKVCEPETFLGDLINVGSTDFTTKATKIGKAEVIGNDDEEIGTFR